MLVEARRVGAVRQGLLVDGALAPVSEPHAFLLVDAAEVEVDASRWWCERASPCVAGVSKIVGAAIEEPEQDDASESAECALS